MNNWPISHGLSFANNRTPAQLSTIGMQSNIASVTAVSQEMFEVNAYCIRGPSTIQIAFSVNFKSLRSFEIVWVCPMGAQLFGKGVHLCTQETGFYGVAPLPLGRCSRVVDVVVVPVSVAFVPDFFRLQLFRWCAGTERAVASNVFQVQVARVVARPQLLGQLELDSRNSCCLSKR